MSYQDSIPLIDDFHIHLRQGALMNVISLYINNKKAVVSHLKESGVGLAYIMPNLQPPIKTTKEALEYKNKFQQLAPDIEFLMTLYLSPDLTCDEIIKAHGAGIRGVKSYPKGVTTNSESGIESYEMYYPVFETMQVGMVLNLHGEIPSDALNDVCVLNAEQKFLKHLEKIHGDFPDLKIVLEHATTLEAVDMVKSLGDSVGFIIIGMSYLGCTITIHHLELVVDDWAGNCHHFCKPVAKYHHDRNALRKVILDRHPRFFLGTDSAPHPRHLKESVPSCAGVYTGRHVAAYLVHVLDSFGALDCLRGFACENGRRFYGHLDQRIIKREIKVIREDFMVENELEYLDDQGVERSLVPFMAGKKLKFSVHPE